MHAVRLMFLSALLALPLWAHALVCAVNEGVTYRALVYPAHLSITAIKNQGYQLVAVTKGYTEYCASFQVRRDAPYKTLADLRSLRGRLAEAGRLVGSVRPPRGCSACGPAKPVPWLLAWSR
jgi:hypothetical protein